MKIPGGDNVLACVRSDTYRDHQQVIRPKVKKKKKKTLMAMHSVTGTRAISAQLHGIISRFRTELAAGASQQKRPHFHLETTTLHVSWLLISPRYYGTDLLSLDSSVHLEASKQICYLLTSAIVRDHNHQIQEKTASCLGAYFFLLLVRIYFQSSMSTLPRGGVLHNEY